VFGRIQGLDTGSAWNLFSFTAHQYFLGLLATLSAEFTMAGQLHIPDGLRAFEQSIIRGTKEAPGAFLSPSYQTPYETYLFTDAATLGYPVPSMTIWFPNGKGLAWNLSRDLLHTPESIDYMDTLWGYLKQTPNGAVFATRQVPGILAAGEFSDENREVVLLCRYDQGVHLGSRIIPFRMENGVVMRDGDTLILPADHPNYYLELAVSLDRSKYLLS
jgi:hypothetical protein